VLQDVLEVVGTPFALKVVVVLQHLSAITAPFMVGAVSTQFVAVAGPRCFALTNTSDLISELQTTVASKNVRIIKNKNFRFIQLPQ